MQQRNVHKLKTLCFLIALVMMFVIAMPLVIAQESKAEECARVSFDPSNFEHRTGLVCMDCHTFHRANGPSLLIPGYVPEPLAEEEELKLDDLDGEELLGDDSEQESALDEEKDQGQDSEKGTDQEQKPEQDDNQDQADEQDPADNQDEDSETEPENDVEPEPELEQE